MTDSQMANTHFSACRAPFPAARPSRIDRAELPRQQQPERGFDQQLGRYRRLAPIGVLGLLASIAGPSHAQTVNPAFHFVSVCRSDPALNRNTVTVTLHGPDQAWPGGLYSQQHTPLAGATLNVLWSYVDYRQNRAVFKYRQDSCITDNNGSCTFHGGSGRARWQLSEVVGYEMSSPAFDTSPTTACPNTLTVDFW